MFAILAALAIQSIAPAGPAARLLSYDEAVRCSGLAQAASELEGGESSEGRALFDAALYWSLATAQAAEVSRRDPAATEVEQTRARLRAVRELSQNEPAARAALARCRARTPDLG